MDAGGVPSVVDVRQWRRIASLGSGRTGSVSLCEGEPIGTSSSPSSDDDGGLVFHAVKRVDWRRLRSGEAARRVVREKNILQALKGHPGIVALRGTSKDDAYLYFVMDPALGGPLHKHIRAGVGGHLEVLATRFYAAEIASAIAHVHGLGFMHRDIKASNIVLSAKGHTKVVDFGCAKQLTLLKHKDEGNGSSGGIDGECEESRTYCGTSHCMAPEMVSYHGHTSTVDWWLWTNAHRALGILIHEMLTGEPPFGYGGNELPQRIMSGLPPETADISSSRPATDIGDQAAGLQRGSECLGPEHGQRFLSIVRQLLEINPQRRLGGQGQGASEVMSHPWFKDVDWERISKHELEPPPFLTDVGELDALEDRQGKGAKEVDPDGEFDDF